MKVDSHGNSLPRCVIFTLEGIQNLSGQGPEQCALGCLWYELGVSQEDLQKPIHYSVVPASADAAAAEAAVFQLYRWRMLEDAYCTEQVPHPHQ